MKFFLKNGAELNTIHNASDIPLHSFAYSGKIKIIKFLIKQGAKLVDCLEDIIEELNLRFQPQKPSLNLTPEERSVFDIISNDGMFLEELIVKSGLERGIATKVTLSLQIKGLIKENKPLFFSKIAL